MDAVAADRLAGTSDRCRLQSVASLLGLAALVAVAHLVGSGLAAELRSGGINMKIGAPPLFGRFDPLITPGLAAPILIAGIVVFFGPRLARSLSWDGLLWTTILISAAWAVALATSNGSITASLDARPDYLAALPQISDLGIFVNEFGDRLGRWPVHVEGHPPGMVVLLFGLARVGLGGSGAAATFIIITGSTVAAAALIAVRALVHEETARRSAPFLVLAPAAVWMATSADAFFAAVIAWSLTSFTLAVTRTGRESYAWGLASGLLFGSALFLSYGAAPFALLFLAIAVHRRVFRLLATAVVGALLVAAAWAVQGFWWFEGLAATISRYESGVAANRPFSFFVWANLAAFAIAVGPAAVLGAVNMKRSRLWILSGTALASLMLADLSGLSKGEVERIWLPFVPWILILAAAIPPRLIRPALVGQATLAIAVQTFVRTPW